MAREDGRDASGVRFRTRVPRRPRLSANEGGAAEQEGCAPQHGQSMGAATRLPQMDSHGARLPVVACRTIRVRGTARAGGRRRGGRLRQCARESRLRHAGAGFFRAGLISESNHCSGRSRILGEIEGVPIRIAWVGIVGGAEFAVNCHASDGLTCVVGAACACAALLKRRGWSTGVRRTACEALSVS